MVSISKNFSVCFHFDRNYAQWEFLQFKLLWYFSYLCAIARYSASLTQGYNLFKAVQRLVTGFMQ